MGTFATCAQVPGTGWATTVVCTFNATKRVTIGKSQKREKTMTTKEEMNTRNDTGVQAMDSGSPEKKELKMNSTRKIAVVAGVFLGALSEVILAIAVVGTAVTLFPIVKRQNESIALGYVCGRLLEAAVIVVGIISLLSVVTLRQNFSGTSSASSASLEAVGKSLVAIHAWAFLLGPNLILGVNTLLLASLMYASRLVPRFIAVSGLIGGTMIVASAIAVMFGLYEQTSTLGLIAALPVLAWEVTLATWHTQGVNLITRRSYASLVLQPFHIHPYFVTS